ncbi:hypothetical protein [Hymenobacter jeollabukensis]|uniref:Uncharacterized protein n=1 Tax=Hymenobacter jeollabukensis TaxID=2025313 RepID=A0A5R8WPD1_9BACT|nr:hypothetical protein [Hymenobacter jeollabukensis]TLM91915.1 hypothetical protein FDY95_15300 [Hymenobacter jeollabukensis]
MARVTRNSLLQGISGKIGGIVVRQVGGQTIVSAAEAKEERAPRSARQQAHLDRFFAAQCYARAQMQDPAAKALYATGVDSRRQSPYHVAIADFMHAPQIISVDTSAYQGQGGDIIRVAATDDFTVASVLLRLETATGELLEEGPALPLASGFDWHYTTRSTGARAAVLHVQASDRPGNVAEQTIRL